MRAAPRADGAHVTMRFAFIRFGAAPRFRFFAPAADRPPPCSRSSTTLRASPSGAVACGDRRQPLRAADGHRQVVIKDDPYCMTRPKRRPLAAIKRGPGLPLMQLDLRRRPSRAQQRAQQCPPAAMQRGLMHLVERPIHQPGEHPLDEKAAPPANPSGCRPCCARPATPAIRNPDKHNAPALAAPVGAESAPP